MLARFIPPCPASACSDGASRTPLPVTPLGPSKEGYRRVGGIAQYRPIPLPMGHPHASAPAARAHGVRDGLVRTVLALVCTTSRAFALTPLRRRPQAASQSPAQLCRRRLARAVEADPRVFASHGCVFRALHRRVKGQKSGQTCTVRSLFFRRPSGPSAVGSDVDQPGGTDPTSGRKHVRAIRKPLGESRPKRGLKGLTRGTQTPRRPRGVCLEPFSRNRRDIKL